MILESIYTPLSVLPILQDKLVKTLDKENLGGVSKWLFLRRCNFYENNTNFQIFHCVQPLQLKKFIVEIVIQKISQNADEPTLFVEVRNKSKKSLKSLLLLINSKKDLEREAQRIVVTIMPILKAMSEAAYISNTEKNNNSGQENIVN